MQLILQLPKNRIMRHVSYMDILKKLFPSVFKIPKELMAA